MSSGLRTLHDIDDAIAKARNNVQEISTLRQQQATDLAKLKRKKLQAFETIATVRLKLIGKNEEAYHRKLQHADRKAASLLSQYQQDNKSLQQQLAELDKQLNETETKRRQQEEIVNQQHQEYTDALEACLKSLEQQPDYQAASATLEEAIAVYNRATQKLEIAELDEAEKGQAYRQSPLFMYLHKRQYGTGAYKANNLIKMLDACVAKICDYQNAAINYKHLTDIPVRLSEHLERLNNTVDEATANLEAIELKAQQTAGVSALEERLKASEQALEAIDHTLHQLETQSQTHREQLDQPADDSLYHKALNILTDAIEDTDYRDLRLLAAQTTSTADDQAIDALYEILEQERYQERQQEDSSKLLRHYRYGLKDLEKVRERYKHAHYDRPNADFPDGGLIAKLISQVVAGLLSSDDLFDHLKKAYCTYERYSDDDDDNDWHDRRKYHYRRKRSRPSHYGSNRSSSRGSSRRSSRGGGFRTGGGF